MGHYATYRKRGSSRGLVSVLPPPPAPELIEAEAELLQYASGLDDTGGEVRLWSRPTPSDPWEAYDGRAWMDVWSWGAVEELPSYQFAATELGNDLVYHGDSAYSNVFDNT